MITVIRKMIEVGSGTVVGGTPREICARVPFTVEVEPEVWFVSGFGQTCRSSPSQPKETSSIIAGGLKTENTDWPSNAPPLIFAVKVTSKLPTNAQ